MEFSCPSCQKLTRVGKKGVSALQDNFYVLPLSTSVKDRNDDIYMSDDGEEIDTTKAAGRVKNRFVLLDLYMMKLKGERGKKEIFQII